MGTYAVFKVRTACEQLQINDRDARVYVHINTMTKQGTQPLRVPRHVGDMFDLGTMVHALKGDTRVHDEIYDVNRLFTDQQYRESMLAEYHTRVLPKIKSVRLHDIIHALTH